MKRVSTEYKVTVNGLKEIKREPKRGLTSDAYNRVYELTITIATFHQKKFVIPYGKPTLVCNNTYKFYKHQYGLCQQWCVLTPFDTNTQSFTEGQSVFLDPFYPTPRNDKKLIAIKEALKEVNCSLKKEEEKAFNEHARKINEEHAQNAKDIIYNGEIIREKHYNLKVEA